MSFKYPYTCPIVDNGIATLETLIKDNLSDVLGEILPDLPGVDYSEYLINTADSFWKSIESDATECYEQVRQSNSDIRDAASDQINDIQSSSESFEQEIDELNNDITQLTIELNEALDKISELETASEAKAA